MNEMSLSEALAKLAEYGAVSLVAAESYHRTDTSTLIMEMSFYYGKPVAYPVIQKPVAADGFEPPTKGL